MKSKIEVAMGCVRALHRMTVAGSRRPDAVGLKEERPHDTGRLICEGSGGGRAQPSGAVFAGGHARPIAPTEVDQPWQSRTIS